MLEISVIISTYNSEKALQKVLWGYQVQTDKNFELVIADDGSTKKTKALIEEFKKEANFPIVHVWHPDNGFQKSEILNKAILKCSTPYIIMSDGDCIPRKDFIAVHNSQKEEGYFLSGGYSKLPIPISEIVEKEDILSNRCFNIKWLKDKGLKTSFRNNKLTSKGLKSKILNTVTTSKATWNGHNASGWKKDLLRVNGFDQRMKYGGQDRELGERLRNLGIKTKQIRYSAVVLHLEHPRPYATNDSWATNNSIRKITRKNKVQESPFGIKNLDNSLDQ